jgi:hypothetical protein
MAVSTIRSLPVYPRWKLWESSKSCFEQNGKWSQPLRAASSGRKFHVLAPPISQTKEVRLEGLLPTLLREKGGDSRFHFRRASGLSLQISLKIELRVHFKIARLHDQPFGGGDRRRGAGG